jgi:hypothetical protein
MPDMDFLAHSFHFAGEKSAAIVDDNSSTGRTVQKAAELISMVAPNRIRATCPIAEADVVRTIVDWDKASRPNIASLEAYRFSVNILPVSRRAKPKVDMRETKEQKILERGYASKRVDGESMAEPVAHEPALRLIREPTEGKLKRLNKSNAIISFRHTELSNFYITPILYNGTQYPSVEHAYQGQKFNDQTLKWIDLGDRAEIEEILRKRGKIWDASNIDQAFSDRNMSCGNMKVIADHLQRRGFARIELE